MSHQGAGAPEPSEGAQHDALARLGLTPGLRLMVISALCFSVMSVLVKLAGRTLDSPVIVLARAGVALVLSWWGLRRLGISPWQAPRKDLLILRGVLGFLGLSCFFYALTHLPLGDATVIMYINPMFVALLAAVVLRERVGGVEIGAVLVSLVGVVLVARPTALFGARVEPLDMVAVGVAFLAACFSAGAYTTVRALGGKAEPLVVVFYFPLIATPAALPYAWSSLRWPTPLEWALLIGVGVFTQLAQIAMTRGLALERASRATSITYLQIVFAYIWGIFVFGEVPSWWSALGAALIIGSALAVVRSRASAEA